MQGHEKKLVQFGRYCCWVEKTTYRGTDEIALVLRDVQNNETVLVATKRLPNIVLQHGEVCIKDYAENEGVFAVLVDAGVLTPTGRTVQSGYVELIVAHVNA